MSKKGIDWENVDWTKDDFKLSMRYGVSRNHVSQMRARLGKPKVAMERYIYSNFPRRKQTV